MKTKIIMALLAGTTLFAACSAGSGKYDSTDTLERQMIDSPKLVKTANMRIKVKSVQTAGESISKLTYLCGGAVIHHNMASKIIDTQRVNLPNDSIKKLTVYNTSADLILKIPATAVEPFMDSLNHLGMFIDGRTMDVEDKTLDYLSAKLKAQNREESVKLRKHIKLTQRGADSILTLKDDVVDRKIGNLRTNQATEYSTLSLTLYQDNTISKVVVANDDLSTYKTPLSVRVGSALSTGWYYFSGLIVVILHFWVFLLAAGGVWLGVYLYKKKKANITQPGA